MSDQPRQGFRLVREPGFVYCDVPVAGDLPGAVTRGWSLGAARCRFAVEKALPDASAELYVNLGPVGRHVVRPEHTAPAARPRAAWVVGPHADALFLAKEIADCDIVGARLRPGVVPSVLGVPAAEVAGRMVDLERFWGSGAVEALRDRLFREKDPLRRVRLLRDEVERRARAASEDGDGFRGLCSAVEAVPGVSVGAVARRFGLTHRRVITLFDRYVGLKPKEYQRVRRLRRVLERVEAGPVRSWARLACEAGYCDQAHLANEFRRLTGLSPLVYSRARSSVGRGKVPHALAGHPAPR